MSQLPFPQLSQLTLGVTLACMSSVAFSAGLDRSGQDIKGFFNEGDFAELTVASVSTNISGYDNAAEDKNGNKVATSDEAGYVQGNEIKNLTTNSYTFMQYGVKADINDNVSVGVFYDEPWGAVIAHEPGKSNFVTSKDQKVDVDGIALPAATVNPNINDDKYIANSNLRIHTETWKPLIGIKQSGVQVYGGPVIQKAKADFQLRGNAPGALTGYDAKFVTDTAVGWTAGVAYTKPEIKLNTAVTYNSAIEHDVKINEKIPLLGSPVAGIAKGKVATANKMFKEDGTTVDTSSLAQDTKRDMKFKTPESVNLNLQSGLSKKHQLMGVVDVRWVPWSKFKVTPPSYNEVTKVDSKDDKGYDLISYSKDQVKVDVALAKRVNDKLAGSVAVGWDSGTGKPVSAFGPVDGSISVGGGVKYNVTPELAVSAGGKYMKFGDAVGKLPNGKVVGNFEDNDGFVAGLKLSYENPKK